MSGRRCDEPQALGGVQQPSVAPDSTRRPLVGPLRAYGLADTFPASIDVHELG